jgi:hypothetical protein
MQSQPLPLFQVRTATSALPTSFPLTTLSVFLAWRKQQSDVFHGDSPAGAAQSCRGRTVGQPLRHRATLFPPVLYRSIHCPQGRIRGVAEGLQKNPCLATSKMTHTRLFSTRPRLWICRESAGKRSLVKGACAARMCPQTVGLSTKLVARCLGRPGLSATAWVMEDTALGLRIVICPVLICTHIHPCL